MTLKKLHVAIISSPGIGHLFPALLFGHRLVTHHNLRVTILAVVTNTSPAESKLFNPFTSNVHLSVIPIPAADISSVVAPDAKILTRICVMMRETVPAIRTTISSMDPLPDVLIGDIFGVENWAIAQELKMPKYVFITGNAWFTALFAYSTVLDKEVVGQFVDQVGPIEIPGCKPIRPEELVDPMLNRDEESYQVHVDLAVRVTLADGMLINTWEGLEPQTLHAFRDNDIMRSMFKNKPVYTVGPIHKKYEPTGLKGEVAEWLDKQPAKSVLYVSFGSGGTISAEQITELAWGLELSGQRFVWVVRSPNKHCVDGSFLNAGQPSGPVDFFPPGFLTRTQEVGLVVTSWAPQVEILNNISVGGFLTHCGWNSTIESIASGVPMIAWPLYAEQNMNATMLTEELKVAVRPEVLPTKKVVGREEVEKMVRSLMEGEEGKAMREKVKALKEGAEEATSMNGSSYISTCKFVEDCLSQIHQ